MKELKKKETELIFGGAGITASLINALSKGFNFFSDLGRYLGSSIRRIFNNSYCDF